MDLAERCELPQRGSGRSPDRPKVFSQFSALRMASPDSIILLYCGLSCSHWRQDPRAPPPCVCLCGEVTAVDYITPDLGLMPQCRERQKCDNDAGKAGNKSIQRRIFLVFEAGFLQGGCPSCHPTNGVKALKWLRHVIK